MDKIIVVGGGAAGFFAAITGATTTPHSQITLLEAGKQPLSKVRISGGGRCNVTHHCFDPKTLTQHYPRGRKALLGAFTRFQPQDTVTWFHQQGVSLKTEADGRMFPTTDDSATIVNCLQDAAKAAGVQVRTRCVVQEVHRTPSWFQVGVKGGEMLKCDRLLIATGSNPLGYRWAQHLGHTIIPPVPSLFTFKVTDPRIEGLTGVSVESVSLRLLHPGKPKLEQTGPLLITHWGLSGPAVLKLSAYGARILHDNQYHLPLQINWTPSFNPETLRQHFFTQKTQTPKRQIGTHSTLSLPKRLWQKLLVFTGIELTKPWGEVPKKAINRLSQEITQSRFVITGKGVFKEEFVTCGGVPLKEVNFKTMESRICPGLYFAGEILDVDGVTGGFNFQNAWTTGWLAGKAMAINLGVPE